MRRNLLLIVIALALLGGCSSLPDISDGTAMVAFPIMKYAKDTNAYYVYYKVYYSKAGVERQGDEEYIKISPKAASFSLRRLEPGTYDIYAIESIYSSSNKVARRIEIEKSFECFPGAISILSNCFEISLMKYPGGSPRQHYDLKVTDEATYQIVKEKLLKLKNADAWEIRY